MFDIFGMSLRICCQWLMDVASLELTEVQNVKVGILCDHPRLIGFGVPCRSLYFSSFLLHDGGLFILYDAEKKICSFKLLLANEASSNKIEEKVPKIRIFKTIKVILEIKAFNNKTIVHGTQFYIQTCWRICEQVQFGTLRDGMNVLRRIPWCSKCRASMKICKTFWNQATFCHYLSMQFQTKWKDMNDKQKFKNVLVLT